MRSTSSIALLLATLTLAACHEPRPAPAPDRAPVAAAAPAPAATPAPTPFPPPQLDASGLDIGPTDAWYSRNSGRVQLNPAATADDLALTLNLITWIVSGDEAAWQKAAQRVEMAFADGHTPLNLPVLPVNNEDAKKYHAAASPHGQKPEKERDPRLEEAYFRKAVVLNPTDPDLWNHLAITSSLQKDYKSAERFAKTAIAVDPTFMSAYQELAYAYKNSERYAEAVKVAERGLNLEGDLHTKAVLLARQGQAYWMLGEKDKALGVFATSKRLGGPAWVNSYLDGKQELGKSWQPGTEPAPSPTPAPTPTPTPAGQP